MTSQQTMATGSTPTLTPKLRFPEFRNGRGWTTQTLGSLASLSTEKVGDKTCIPMSITSGVGLVSQQEKFGRTIAGSSYKNYLQLRKNDFAYNKSATKEFPQGFIALYSGDELAAVPNSIFTCFRIKGDSPDPKYLNYLFLGNLHGRWLRKYVEVSARAHGSLSIDDDDLLTIPVPIPSGESSLAEQKKIAECLSTLDELLGAESQKLDTFKAHKEGLMQKLFPREGETLPRLRFPEFHNAPEWDEKVLSAIAEPVSERAENEERNNILTLSAEQGIILQSEYFGKKIAGTNAERYLKIKRNDFVYNDRTTKAFAYGTIKRLAKYAHGIVSPIYKCFRFQTDEEPGFWEWYFETGRHDSQLRSLANEGARTGRFNVSIEKFLSTSVWAPLRAEQQKIASCFFSLDDLIVTQSDKLEALKAHKKGLMQQLFPSPAEAEA